MNKSPSDAATFVQRLVPLLPPIQNIDVVLAPPFTALQAVREALGPTSSVRLAAQNLFWEDQGAYTGEISAPMLKDLCCSYVIVGHSERRKLFGELDEGINKKVRAALRHGLQPILCVGELLAERDKGQTEAVVCDQLIQGLSELNRQELLAVTIAYEPVWAIGTGRAATPAQAIEVHSYIRQIVNSRWHPDNARTIRILYGGSVTPQNTVAMMESDQIDGALVGGACLDANSFATIVSLAQSSSHKQ